MRTVLPTPIPIVHDPVAGMEYKPRHRGRLHQVVFFLTIPAAIALLIHTQSTAALISCAVYLASLVGLFFTSSLYNRCAGTPKLRPWMRWLDHAMIFAFIAGTYTPIAAIALSRRLGVLILVVEWGATLAGLLLKFTSLRRFRRVGGVLYVFTGGLCVLTLPALFSALSTPAFACMLLGTSMYGIGGLCLWTRRPNPSRDFGYHEIWHTFVVFAALLHFVMIWLTVSRYG